MPNQPPHCKLRVSAAEKLEACENMLQHNRRVGSYMPGFDKKKNAQEQQLQKICRDTNKVANEHIKGISTQVETSSSSNAWCSSASCCCVLNWMLLHV